MIPKSLRCCPSKLLSRQSDGMLIESSSDRDCQETREPRTAKHNNPLPQVFAKARLTVLTFRMLGHPQEAYMCLSRLKLTA